MDDLIKELRKDVEDVRTVNYKVFIESLEKTLMCSGSYLKQFKIPISEFIGKVGAPITDVVEEFVDTGEVISIQNNQVRLN